MAFISNCPKCQKSVLVPDGHGHDAVVQCPACFAEYALGEILAAAPPALIVVRAGTPVANGAEPALEAAGAMGGGMFSTHRGEPAHHDLAAFGGETLEFAHAEGGRQGDDTIFAPSVAVALGEHGEAIEHLDEALAVPLDGDGHPMGASKENGDAWGESWNGFGDAPTAVEGEEAVGLAEADEGLENVNFADITGKPAPGTTIGDGTAVTIEPPKKKKRKREANPLVRILGIVFFGLLALPCSLLLAKYVFHQPMDFLPGWVPAWFRTTKTVSQPVKPRPAAPAPSAANTTSVNGTPAATVNQPGSGALATSNTSAITEGDKPTVSGGTTTAGSIVNSGTPASAAHGNKKEIAANNKGGAKIKPPVTDESGDVGESAPSTDNEPKLGQPDKGDLAPPPAVAPVGDKPKAETPNKPGMPAKPKADAKPDDSDPFAPTPSAAVGGEKPKAEVKPAAPAKPDTSKPNASKPDTGDPFGTSEPTKPIVPNVEKPKTEVKPAAPVAPKPDASKPDSADPFSAPAPSAPSVPNIEKPKTEFTPPVPESIKPDAIKPDEKPRATAPQIEKPKIETPIPSKPAIIAPNISTPLKPDIVKPDLTPEAIKPVPTKPAPIKPEIKPAPLKPAVGPLNAESFAPADLDAALKAAPAGAADAKSYAAWCKLAEVTTFAAGESAAQQQSIHGLVDKAAGNPQSAAAIAASAKKLLDDKATQGGIVLIGKVSKIASKNGLVGMAIHMQGMTGPVMIFSSHALDAKEGQSVIVLGALVSEPGKNLPGYTGKQPVIVWSDFAAPAP